MTLSIPRHAVLAGGAGLVMGRPGLARAQAAKGLAYAISRADITLTTGQPDHGAGGYQFTGLTLYDTLVAWELDVAGRPGKLILVYFIPGDGADTTQGKCRLNWVWYVGVSDADLPRLLVDRDGRQHHASLPFGGTPDSAIHDLRDLARREMHPMLAALVAATAQPFLQTIVDVAPTRTVFGRVCHLGDAAFVVRPHTAGATAKAARDATDLARALKRAGQNIDAGLSGFEEMQIAFGWKLADYGVALGRRWVA